MSCNRHFAALMDAPQCNVDVMMMDQPTTILLTPPSTGLMADILRQHADWRVVTMADHPPAEPLVGDIWAFVDWLCPNISGLELCRRLRRDSATKHAHITMIIDSFNGEACRRALDAGADDYLVGPLDLERLSDRIAPRTVGHARITTATPSIPAIARVSPTPLASTQAKPQGQQLVHSGLTVDLIAHRAHFRGTTIPLRPNEFRLLVFFLQHPNRVHSRAALIAALWSDDSTLDERTIDVWVGRLRRALVSHGAADPIRTVRFMGYVLDSTN